MKNEVIEEVVVENVDVTEVAPVKESRLAKPIAAIKKNGKKVVVGIALAGFTILGYVVGKQAGINSVDTDKHNTDYNEPEDEPEAVETTEF